MTEAVAKAVNVPAILQTIMRGNAEPASQLVSPAIDRRVAHIVRDLLRRVVRDSHAQVRFELGSKGLPSVAHELRVGDLSGGQKARITDLTSFEWCCRHRSGPG